MKLLIVSIFVLISQVVGDDILDQKWNNYKAEFGKRYLTEEEDTMRKGIFIRNLEEIEKHNALNGITYTKGVNKFTDMEPKEYMGRLEIQSVEGGIPFTATLLQNFPKSYNWIDKGAVTPVKDQNTCGSCWAFATVGAMEGAHRIKHDELLLFSEQQLVDCSRGYGNHGCRGGWLTTTFKYIQDNGLQLAENYPYKNRDGVCTHTPAKAATRISNFTVIRQGDEDGLQNAVHTKGPVPILIDAAPWGSYKEGIFNDPSCSSNPNDLTHAALVVGWDTDINGKSYWIVKNSWGTGWGENGYIKLIMGSNMCGVANFASYPNM